MKRLKAVLVFVGQITTILFGLLLGGMLFAHFSRAWDFTDANYPLSGGGAVSAHPGPNPVAPEDPMSLWNDMNWGDLWE